ncbi:MAG: phosphotransferase [Burkholderiaceae bacterium]|nr:phosphotransferase [Burkholderiaceae bacterium]
MSDPEPHPLRTPAASGDARLAQLRGWLSSLPPRYRLDLDTLRPASDDASFRRYFRLAGEGTGARSLIAMDAPPPMEDCRPFVHAAGALARVGMTVPRVYEADLDRGFLLLQDFGSRTYLDEILAARAAGAPADGPARIDAMYADASAALLAIQRASVPGVFPPYDRELLRRELMLFVQWYLERHRKFTPDAADSATIEKAFEALLLNNLAQPCVFVHRDFHSRNLMLLEGAASPGVLDFQDAVYGPITYDLVSLLRDAYLSWPEERVIDWAVRHWQGARAAGLPVATDFAAFYRDFEWMGLQRHLKVLGIFARLSHRDGKDRYLADLPLVLEYVLEVAKRYREFGPLARLIERVEGRERSVRYTF